MIKKYILITKPAIVVSNLVSVAGGFFLASKGDINFVLLTSVLVSVALVIAAGCVFNNSIDRDIDLLMARTRTRALAVGAVSPGFAFAYSLILALAGFSLIYYQTNLLASAILLLGFIVYAGLYTLYFKRNSVHGTLVGSIAGATPPVVGYCAVSNQFDAGAILLLLIFCIWQMPHSYAIAIYRLNDYKAASIPVLPAKIGIAATRIQIITYIILFMIACFLLTVLGYSGPAFLVVVMCMSLYWLYISWFNYEKYINRNDGGSNEKPWAKKIFLFSIILVMGLNIMMAVDYSRPQPSVSLVNLDAH